MNENQRIELTDSPLEILMKLAEGNPGAATAMMKMMEEAPAIDPQAWAGSLQPLLALDSIGIYGPHIWGLWKDVCDRSVLKSETLFRGVQLGLLRSDDVLRAARMGRHSFDFDALLASIQAQVSEFGRASMPVESSLPTPV